MAFGLCPPVKVAKGLGSLTFPHEMQGIPDVNKYCELKGLLLWLLSQRAACGQARWQFAVFKGCAFCGYLLHSLFFSRMEGKKDALKLHKELWKNRDICV